MKSPEELIEEFPICVPTIATPSCFLTLERYKEEKNKLRKRYISFIKRVLNEGIREGKRQVIEKQRLTNKMKKSEKII